MNEFINAILFKEPKSSSGAPPLLLFFKEDTAKNERESKNGPPVYDIVHTVRVVVAGSRGGEGPIYELARKKYGQEEWKTDQYAYNRFGKPYEDWKAGRASADAGTPLEQWPLMDAGLVAAFKAANVYTVQQLAGLSDGLLDTAIRRGGREWRAKAIAWLDEAKTAAGDVEARATIARQQDQIDQLTKTVAQLQKSQNTPGFDKPKRGRQTREDHDDDVVVSVVEEAGASRL
jgi:hypothetical protein